MVKRGRRRSKRRSRGEVLQDLLDEVEVMMICAGFELEFKRKGGRDYVA